MKRLSFVLLHLALLLAPADAGRMHGIVATGGAATCATSDAACDSSSVTLFNAMTTPPDARHRVCINNTIVSLKAASIWSTYDVLYGLMAADSQASSLNWVSPGTFPLSLHNSPVFVRDQGWSGNGTTEWLDSTYAPSTNGVKYTAVDGHHFGYFINTNKRADSSGSYGGRSGSATAGLNPWNSTTNNAAAAVNNTLVATTAQPQNSQGLFIANRVNNPSNFRVIQNGAVLETALVGANGTRPTYTRVLSLDNSNFTQRPMAFVGFGASLTPTQEQQLTAAVQGYVDCLTGSVLNYVARQQTTDKTTQVTRFDTDGNAIDLHNGGILQVGNLFYGYSEAHGCGYRPGTAGSPWCGIKVYTTPDLNQNWTYRGPLFDPNAGGWQADCATSPGGYTGCYSPSAIYNASTGKYVVYIMRQTTISAATHHVWLCDTPDGGASGGNPGTNCVQQADISFVVNPGPAAFAVDPVGDAYAIYDDLGAGYAISVIKMNAAYTQPVGSPVSVGFNGEGLWLFFYGGNTYVFAGSTGCAYCTNASASVAFAPTPLGTYSASQVVSTGSCQSQPFYGAIANINGNVTPIWKADQMWGQTVDNRANQGFANIYFAPLQFSSNGGVKPIDCSPIVNVPGLTATPVSTVYPGVTSPDQSAWGFPSLNWCDISNTNWRMQTFTPTRSPVISFNTPLGKNNGACTVGSSCPAPDGSLVADLVTLDGSKNPVSVLATVTITAANLDWNLKTKALNFNQAVTPGTEYGVRFKSSGQTNGCFGLSFNQAGAQPYASGAHRTSADSGANWSTVTNSTMPFATN